jgi:hypothetical protein
MEMFTVYRSPADYPGQFVVRRWLIGPGTVTPIHPPFAVENSLAAAREKIPEGLYRMPRCEKDDPVVEEVWF